MIYKIINKEFLYRLLNLPSAAVHFISSSLLIFFFMFALSPIYSQNKLKTSYSQTDIPDTLLINSILKTASDSMIKGALNQSAQLANSALLFSKKIGFKPGICRSLNLKGKIFSRQSNNDSCIIISKQSLIIAKEIKDSIAISDALLNIGNAAFSSGDFATSSEYNIKGLVIEERLKVKKNLFGFLNNLGSISLSQKKYSKTLEYYEKAKIVAENLKDNKRLAIVYHNIGLVYLDLRKYDSARYAFKKLNLYTQRQKDIYIINAYPTDMALLYFQLKQYDSAYYYAYKVYQSNKNGFKDQLADNVVTLANILIEQEKYAAAEDYLKEALGMLKEMNSNPVLENTYQALAELHEKKKDFRKAYDYYILFAETKSIIENEKNSRRITETNIKYTSEKKEKEIELLKRNEDIQNLQLSKKKNELDRQHTVSVAVFVGFLLLMIVAILMFSRDRLKKKANDQLQNAFNLIEEKNMLIEKSNVMITDSITYAKRIQDAILPASEDLTKLFSDDFFVFYLPSQIVSGDFYWCSTQQNKIIFVVADCTGHGVPGAFMSMIGNTLLNEIVNERKVTDTKRIAELLDEKIIHALHQHEGSEKYDGMDISICSIDEANKEISFTGAHHAMYAYDTKLQKIKGDSYSIGGAQQQQSKTFTSHKMAYKKGTRLYFLTDGYCDQSGGEASKRFSSKGFETLLNEVQELSMNEQKKKLEDAFEQWKGTTKQRDDILVVGIKC